jgi:hypothetical protein
LSTGTPPQERRSQNRAGRAGQPAGSPSKTTNNREDTKKLRDPARPEGDLYQRPYRTLSLNALGVAEVVPHLGLPIREPICRHALRQSMVSPGPGGPIPALLGSILEVSGPGPGGLRTLLPREGDLHQSPHPGQCPDLILRSRPGRAGNLRFLGSKRVLLPQNPLEKVVGEAPPPFPMGSAEERGSFRLPETDDFRPGQARRSGEPLGGCYLGRPRRRDPTCKRTGTDLVLGHFLDHAQELRFR